MTSQYELLYIIPTTFTDDEVGTVETKVNAILSKVGATTDSTRRLGKFQLAYAIQKQRHGHYVLVQFQAERGAIAKLDELLRITPEVLRHLIVRADEGGAEAKFDLVQFAEVVVEGRDSRRRDKEKAEKEAAAKDDSAKEEIKEAVEALTEGGDEESKPTVQPSATISSEELDSKIETALNEDVKGV